MVTVMVQPRARTHHYVTGETESATTRVYALMQAINDSRPDWMKDPRRNCAGYSPQIFYGSDVAAAVCQGCPFIDACLWYAIDNNEKYGVWGGTSERQRRKIRKRMGLPND